MGSGTEIKLTERKRLMFSGITWSFVALVEVQAWERGIFSSPGHWVGKISHAWLS